MSELDGTLQDHGVAGVALGEGDRKEFLGLAALEENLKFQGGLMTVPYRAFKLGRKAVAFELNPGYFLDGVAHVEAAEREVSRVDLLDAERETGA